MGQYYPDYVTPVASARVFRQRLKRLVAEDWFGYEPESPAIPRPLRLLRKALTLPLRSLLRQVPRWRPGGRVLDIGCGSGGYLAFLARTGWSCYGVEPGRNSRSYAQEVLGLTVLPGPLEECAFSEGYFDVVTMWHVIEHFSNPPGALQEIHRILKPDGILMLRTPNIESWEARLFKGSWFGLDTPRHFFLFSLGTIRTLLVRNGFEVTRLWQQHHPTILSRSVLYFLEDRKLTRTRKLVARVIRWLDLGLTVCAPLRSLFRRGGIIHIEAGKAVRPGSLR